MTIPAPAAMVLAAFMFACMGVFAKLAADHYGAAELMFYRSLVGGAVMALVARHQGVSLKTAIPGAHLARSASGVFSMFLWLYSLTLLPLSTAVTLNYLSSVWIAVVIVGTAVLLRRRVDLRLVLAVLGGFGGVTLVLQPSFDAHQWVGGAAGLLAGFSAALAYLQIGAMGRAGEPELRVVFYFSLAGSAAGAVLAQIGGWHAHSVTGVLLLLAMALPAAAGQLLLTRAYGSGGTLVAASLQDLGIVFTTILGMLVFDEHIGWAAAAGMAAIIVSGVWASWAQSHPPREPVPCKESTCHGRA